MSSHNDANDDRARPRDEGDSKHTPAGTIPAVDNRLSRWIATEPTEIQLCRAIRLVGEPQRDGSLAPLRVCGYVFRVADVENWMDSQPHSMPELEGPRADRADRGWGYIINSLSPHGITCWFVRTYLLDKYGNEMTLRCSAKSLILGTNETKQERMKARNMKKIELIHRVLNLPMGTLGAPQWLVPAERR